MGTEFSEIGPQLSVFNSSSYAVQTLVNIFTVQGKLDDWESYYKKLFNGNPRKVKLVLGALRRGYNPILFQRILMNNPTIVDTLGSPEGTRSIYEDYNDWLEGRSGDYNRLFREYIENITYGD